MVELKDEPDLLVAEGDDAIVASAQSQLTQAQAARSAFCFLTLLSAFWLPVCFNVVSRISLRQKSPFTVIWTMKPR